MRVSKMFRFRSDRPSVIIAALVIGMVLSVAGSVLATSIGDSVSVTSTLSVTGASTLTGNVGIATSTAGSALSIQGVANFTSGATSTVYSILRFPIFSATSTTATSTLSTGGLTIGDTQFVVQQNSGRVGIGTSTPGSLLSVQGIANFTQDATSTIYSRLTFPIFMATSTTASSTLSTGGFVIGSDQFVVQQNSGWVGIGTSTPGSLFSVQGVGNFSGSTGTSTLYSRLALPIFMATSTTATSTLSTGGFAVGTDQFVVQQTTGRVGVGTSTPGTLLSVQGVANFVGTADATSSVYSKLSLPSFTATSTVATTTISTGGFQVGSQGAAAFTVLQSATTSVGVGTSTPTSHQFAVAGNALIGTTGTTTLVITSATASTGSCIQLRAASSSNMYRLYLGFSANNASSSLVVEEGACR